MLQKGLETMIGLARETVMRHADPVSRHTSADISMWNLELTASSVILKLWQDSEKVVQWKQNSKNTSIIDV